MEVLVDTDKLAWGLEKGIERTDTFFAHMPQDIRLRHASCGLVSSAIRSYALNEGLDARLLIASPLVPFDTDLQHVVALIEADPNNPTIIDASISQFLGYAGITTAYEEHTGETLFPPEKVMSFGLQDMNVAVEWLTKAVRRLRHNHPMVDVSGTYIAPGPLDNAPIEEVQAAYEAIYNPQKYHTWMPPHHVVMHGDQVASAIPSGAIIVK